MTVHCQHRHIITAITSAFTVEGKDTPGIFILSSLIGTKIYPSKQYKV
jgi:hypothetical protein